MSNICINFCKWIAAMEPDDESCLDLMRPSKDIATEIHPHYNEVFQRLDCSLSDNIWCATSRRNKIAPAKPWKDSEYFILGDRKCKSLASAENCKIRAIPLRRLRYHFFHFWCRIFVKLFASESRQWSQTTIGFWSNAKTSRMTYILNTIRCFNHLTAFYPKISDAQRAIETTWWCQRNLIRIHPQQ